MSPHSESDDEAECGRTNEASDISDDGIATLPVRTDSGSDTDVESPSVLVDYSAAMEMIMVKDVKAGAEVSLYPALVCSCSVRFIVCFSLMNPFIQTLL